MTPRHPGNKIAKVFPNMVGQTILHYRITVRLGAGGMGEVYHSTDTRLGREVALKFLPDLFANDPERLQRFEREAQLLASLNHPRVGSIYGLEEANGLRFLALELVEGPTLADRIAEGPIPATEALKIAEEIAEGIDAAHEKGIIHRDLKPANIKLTADGHAVVLDFGLAKALEGQASDAVNSHSPTISQIATLAGTLLGTAAYMSPEQARGKTADKRADIWAFGVVLYEMLTGKQPFSGETLTETLAAIMRGEPDWTALPGETPAAIRRLLRRCLEKDPKRRLRDIGDARMEIADVLSGHDSALDTAVLARVQPAWRRVAPWSLAAVLAVFACVALWSPWRAAPAPPVVARFTIALRPNEVLAPGAGGLAISPDGAYVGYTSALSAGGTRQLFLRPMDRSEAVPVPGTDDATGPFFSPDGEWIAFTAGGKLKKVPLAGGTPIVLCDRSGGQTGSWGPDGTIFFFEAAGLMRVPAAGGTPQVVTTTEIKPGEQSPRLPEVLPGGEAILYVTGGTLGAYSDDATIIAQSLRTGERKTVIQGGTSPHYLSTGHIVYAQGGRLFAVPFDLRRLEVTGAAAPILEDVWQGGGGYAAYSVSPDGSLVYINGGEAGGGTRSTLNWVDRTGTARRLNETTHVFSNPSLSPDGRSLAIINGDIAPTGDVWISDLTRGTLARLTFGKPGEQAFASVWTPDGKRVIYARLSGSEWKLTWRPADGSGAEELLFSSNEGVVPMTCSPDGQLLVFYRTIHGHRDLWMLPLTGDHKPRPLIESPFDKVAAQISPDGHWLAYSSNESGRQEVFVQPFPGLSGKWQISTAGGAEPRWSRDGRQLFYLSGNKMMAVEIETKAGFTAGSPRLLFDQPYAHGRTLVNSVANYDVAPDGQHFLMLKEDQSQSSQLELRVVLNWAEEVTRRLGPAKK